MLEINRSSELTEMKKPTADGFKCIEPQSKMTSHEAQKYWDSKFEKENTPVKYGGGSYEDVKNYSQENKHENVEAHHMPADASSTLDRTEGPCIEMKKEDHRKTASCGNSIEAREYRAKQKELIDKGDFRGAIQMDIDDIRGKFGDKYDAQIKEMLEYVDKLEQGGKI